MTRAGKLTAPRPCTGYDVHPMPQHPFVYLYESKEVRNAAWWVCQRCGTHWCDGIGRASPHCTATKEWLATHPADNGQCTGVVR